MKVKRGNIVYLKHKEELGHIQQGKRPFLVVSNDSGNRFSQIAMVVPLTKQTKKLSQPTHTLVNYHNSMVLCEQILTINQDEVDSIVFTLNEYQMKRVDECLKVALGIER